MSLVSLYKKSLNHSFSFVERGNFEYDYSNCIPTNLMKNFSNALFNTKPYANLENESMQGIQPISGKLLYTKITIFPIIKETFPRCPIEEQISPDDISLAVGNPFEMPKWITTQYPPFIGETTKVKIINPEFRLRFIRLLHNNKIKLIPLYHALYDTVRELTKFVPTKPGDYFNLAIY